MTSFPLKTDFNLQTGSRSQRFAVAKLLRPKRHKNISCIESETAGSAVLNESFFLSGTMPVTTVVADCGIASMCHGNNVCDSVREAMASQTAGLGMSFNVNHCRATCCGYDYCNQPPKTTVGRVPQFLKQFPQDGSK